jgi:hypothetical protein
MLIYWLSIIATAFVIAAISILAIISIKRRGEHHYDNQESDGSCDPMDDKIDGYDDN